MSALRIALVGASGRMGQAIARIAAESDDLEIVAQISEGDDMFAAVNAGANVAIDFSTPKATVFFARIAADAKLPVVIGTTGLEDYERNVLKDLAQRNAIFFASNMSVGVYVLGELVARAAQMLGPDFDIEIVEAHHRKKVDAPSGTALTLLDIARRASAKNEAVHGRSGKPGARPKNEIGVHAVRGGDVVGDHHVHFLADGERLELTHRATSRDVFARGALRAARFVAPMPPGLYRMRDLFAGT